MALALAAVLSVGCVQEQFELDPNKVPSASDLQVKIDVDQATNYVTFSIENQGMVPMWLFGEEKIDGKANKKYAYTGNGIQLRLRDAGTHSVEVKAYNAHGISVGSKVVEFTLENTYRDPFDPSKYITFFAGSESKTWEWNSTVKGHMGCGEPGTDGTNWWSAGPDEKVDCGLYDDRLTFTKDMKYTYNPGEGGTVYVNKDSGYGTEYNPNDGNDYQVPIEGYTTDYSFENAWNDAGIEEIYLVLPANTNLSYIPNPEAYAEPRFKLLEGTNTKKLALVHDNGGISWKYEFIIEGSAKPEDPKPQPGEVVFDPNSDRNLWKNAAMDVSFWFANNDWGQIDNPAYTVDGNKHTIVIPEGIGTQRWQGQMVFNNTGIVTSADKTYDFQLVLNSTADHAGVTIKLTQQDNDNVFFFEDAHAVTAYEEFKYQVKGIQGVDLTNAKLVLDFGGAVPGSTVEIKDIVLQEHIDGGTSGPAPFDPASPDNLWNNAVTTDHHFWFANNDWGEIAPATVTSDGGTHTFVLPDEIGGQQWQGQFFFQNTGLSSSAEKTYDFYCVLNSSEDHPGVTVKLCAQDDDGAIIVDVRPALVAYEDYEVKIIGAAGIDCDNLKLVLDFGGGVGGSTVVVKDIIFRESQSAPAPEPEPTPGEFTPGAQLDLLDAADVLPGTWTWEASTDGHFGCGDAIANPCGWWNGTANCKEGCSMYDDLMTFAADGTYTYDPVDGMTFMNTGVTKMNDKKVDNPTVPGAAAPEGDFRVSVEKQTATWELDEFGDFPAIILPAGTIFSYIPNDAFLEAPELYITGVWENQLEISAYTATGNNGGPIAWRYRLKRVK